MHFRSFQIFRDASRIFQSCWFEMQEVQLWRDISCLLLFLRNDERARTMTRIVGGSWEAERELGMKVWR